MNNTAIRHTVTVSTGARKETFKIFVSQVDAFLAEIRSAARAGDVASQVTVESDRRGVILQEEIVPEAAKTEAQVQSLMAQYGIDHDHAEAVLAKLVINELVSGGMELSAAWDVALGAGSYQRMSDSIFAAVA